MNSAGTELPYNSDAYEPSRRIPLIRLGELMQPTFRRLTSLAVALSYVWALATIARHQPVPYWRGLVAPVALALGATMALRFPRPYVRAALIFGFALCTATVVEVLIGHLLTGQWLIMASVLAVGLLLGPTGAAGASAVICLFTLPLPLPQPQRLLIVGQAMFATALVWVAGNDIAHALSQAEKSEERAWRQATEAMRRRGELQATSKALRDMYALLERTNTELAVARREAEEAKEIKARFAANISHELRTPLNLIMGFSRLMYRSPEVYGNVQWTPELRADIREIHSASRHLLGMVDDILDLARIDAQRLPLKLEPASIATLIEEAATTARGLLRGSPVSLSTNVAAGLPEVVVDRTRIRQVLLNLLSNAIRFTDNGWIAVPARVVDGEIEVAVADTGVGIPTDDLPTIFDEFSQAKGLITSGRGGAGLGLAICRQFVQLHGGRITVESEVGKGSTFRFTLPLPSSGRARSRLSYYSPSGQPLPPSHKLGKSVVILAQDEASSRLLARSIEGYRAIPVTEMRHLRSVVEAEHPAGIVLVRNPLAREESTKPEDIWQAAGRLDLGIIEWEVPMADLAREYLQVQAYLTKPVEVEQLVSAIRQSGASTELFLVVDDDPGFRSLMERVLAAAFPGGRTRTCADGEEALAAMRRQHYDILILDLAMPGLGGVALLSQARKDGLLAHTKVIVTTGAAYVEELATVFSPKLHFSKGSLAKGTEWFRCLQAILDSAPPDYSLPAAAS